MAKVSVLILTLNEEINLADCLKSCAWCDDVVVFDSNSADRTAEIAKHYGARVVQRTFDSYAGQRMAALNTVAYKYPWVLMVDADERVPASLAQEIEQAIKRADEQTTIFRMRRKDFFFGRWLRRSSGYPTWFGRLVRIGRVRVEREVNEEYLTDGKIEHLQQHLEHFPFNKGITWWYERHNRYSSMEAVATATERSEPVQWQHLFRSDPIQRRRALKRLSYKLPGRPVVAFLYLYFIRLGIFDGIPGLYYCAMRASYEFMIALKVRELQRSAKLVSDLSAKEHRHIRK